MCNFSNDDEKAASGFLVDAPEIRHLIEETQQLMRQEISDAERVDLLRPTFSKLLTTDHWLPDQFAQADHTSGMGGGIGQYALYRAENGSLCLFSLVIPSGAETPVHDHLAWGLVGVYRGQQFESVYQRLDDESDDAKATLKVTKQQTLDTGQFYTLLPPRDDIHRVKTVSDAPSVSIHLLANDTACVWRHQFDPTAGTVVPFRSGYSNSPCPPASTDAR
jgi:predicted metal-dependent enzyme (double-stranded beta helix superfamily)